ncbi:hypothetical protein CHS0354_013460 [Potamilus streckersoni]|uniref:Uncharacterized protein n=1 Tax=Potamilus streckersoni TaxID=2493646 RepID=A0AAE0RZ13_9BIVA|nr:hypothetical protein CHS0354_013460 [Potamilus streckersoni]
MASRTHIRRSYEQRRRTYLQPEAFSSPFRRRSIPNAGNDVIDGIDISAINDMMRRGSFPAGIIAMNEIGRNASCGRGLSKPSQKFSCTPLTDKRNLKPMDTLMLEEMNNRFRNLTK